MKFAKLMRPALVSATAALALLTQGAAHAVLSVGLYATTPTTFTVDNLAHSVSYEVRFNGLTADDSVLRAYNFTVAYDPTVLSLTGWSGFGTSLGTGGQVANVDYTGFSGWDYTQANVNDPTPPATYFPPGPFDPTTVSGLDLGTPGGTCGSGSCPGSLRFFQTSSLGIAALEGLQHLVGNSISLFSLTFEIVADAVKHTGLSIIDDTNYADFATTDPLDYQMDYKNGGGDPYNPFPTKVASEAAAVPAPAPLLLIALGLVGLARRGRSV